MKFIFIYLIPISIIGMGLYLCFATEIIRDISTATKKPYSLSRTQLMWWTLIILSCFSIQYGWTSVMPQLNGGLLALLGIGTGTATLANLIDKNDAAQNRIMHQNGESKGFLIDILDDGKGISVHRFQAFVFNVILGIIFMNYFFAKKEFPEFKEYELGLLGISSAAYLSIKANENK